jgi:flagellar hook-basal body complex protein FliE
MSVPGIEAIGFTPFAVPQLPADQLGAVVATAGPQAPSAPSAVSGPSPEFGHLLTDGIDRLEAVQDHADQLAVQAATGDLSNIHDYTIAATEASVTTQLTVAVRNRALEAFNEIMRMPV